MVDLVDDWRVGRGHDGSFGILEIVSLLSCILSIEEICAPCGIQVMRTKKSSRGQVSLICPSRG